MKPSTLKTHSPLLVNAEAMALDHPKTFKRPSAEAIDDVRLRDHVKVAISYYNPSFISGESFWLEVVMRSSGYWIGQCKSKLLFGSIKIGELVKFHPCNIYDICKHEEES